MAGTPVEIPLSPDVQTLSIDLGLKTYNLFVKYVDQPEGGWILDISNADGVLLVAGIPLVTGADLLAQYEYLEIPGQLIVQTDHDTDAVPTFDNLGINSHLFFIPNE